MGFVCPPALSVDRALRDGICHLPPEPTHSVSTLPASRPEGHPLYLPAVTPATLLSFLTFRVLFLPEIRFPSPGPILSCRLTEELPLPRATSEVSPSGNRFLTTIVAARREFHTLLAFAPSEAFPSTASESGFPAPSSFALRVYLKATASN